MNTELYAACLMASVQIALTRNNGVVNAADIVSDTDHLYQTVMANHPEFNHAQLGGAQ